MAKIAENLRIEFWLCSIIAEPHERIFVTVELEITHFSSQINIPDEELEGILRVASWQIEPQFPYPGRTAWHILKKPICLNNAGNRTFHAAKLKGIGGWNPENYHLFSGIRNMSFDDKPIQPTTQEYKFTSSIAHFGFTEQGYFQTVYSEPAPYCGILHRRAVMEYENQHRMLANGVPSLVPLLVARLPESYQFNHEDMGIVVSLSEEKDPFRLHLIHFGENELRELEHKYYTKLRHSLGIKGNILDEKTRLQTNNALAGQIGKLMHDFSATGLYRHSGGWEDLSFCVRNKQVFLVDLDSCRTLAELPACVRPLQILRDLSSSIHKLLNMFYFPTIIDKYNFSNLVAYDPISKLLSAYFPASQAGKIKRIADRFWNFFAPYLFLMKRNLDQISKESGNERRIIFKVDDEIFFTLSLLNLFTLYEESDLNSIYPCECTIDDLKERSSVFLGERHQYVDYLLANN